MKRFILLLLTLLLLGSVSHAAVPWWTSLGSAGDPYILTDCNMMQWAMDNNTNNEAVWFELGNDIDCSSMGDFEPIGTAVAQVFSGHLDGKGYIISNVQINGAGPAKGSLFEYTTGDFNNFGLVDFNIWNSNVGAAALAYESIVGLGMDIRNVYVQGGRFSAVAWEVAGLVSGISDDTNIVDCYILDVNLYAPFAQRVGGLAAYTTGNDANVFHNYSNAEVTGIGSTGGLIGIQVAGATIDGNNFWDTETSGQAVSIAARGRTTAEMYKQGTFTFWDFNGTGIWQIEEDVNYPMLQYFSETVRLNITTIGGEAFSTNPAFAYIIDGNVPIGFTVSNGNNNRLTIDLNYSQTTGEGEGTVIVKDLNLTSDYCADQDWDDSPSQCFYDFNFFGIADGNYTILGLVKNATAGTEQFDTGDGNFEIANDVNLTINIPIDETTGELIDTNVYSFTVKILTGGIQSTYAGQKDENSYTIPLYSPVIISIDTNVDAYYWGREYYFFYDTPTPSDTLQPYLATLASSVLTTIHTVSMTTLTAIPDMRIRVYKDLEGGRTLINDSVTDGKGETAVAFVIADNYEIEVWDGDEMIFEENYIATATTSNHYIYLPVEGIVEFPEIPNVSIRYLPGIREHTTKDVNISVIVESNNEAIDSIQIAFYSNGVTLLDTQRDSLVSADGNTYTINVQNFVGFDTEYPLDVNVTVWLADGTFVTSKTDGWWFRFIGLEEDSMTWLLTHGMRRDFGCQHGSIEALGTTCQPLFLMAIFIMFLAVGGLALNQFRNGSALAVLAILFTALFVYITWIPFVWGVLMAVAGVLIIIVKSRIDS